jgi:hypothetical protein
VVASAALINCALLAAHSAAEVMLAAAAAMAFSLFGGVRQSSWLGNVRWCLLLLLLPYHSVLHIM